MSKTFFFGHTKIVQAKRNTKLFFIFLQENNKQKKQVVQNEQETLTYKRTAVLMESVSVRCKASAQASPLH